MRSRLLIFILLIIPMTTFAKKVATGDITMESFTENIKQNTAVLTLRNNMDEEVRQVKALLIYMDEEGKNLGRENIRTEVTIPPHAIGSMHVKGLGRANYIYYKQKRGDEPDAKGYMVAFELKDYELKPAQDVQEETEGSSLLWNIIRITLGLTIILVLVLIWIVIPTRLIGKKRNRKVEILLLLCTGTLTAYGVSPSGTLPIVYVTTANGAPVTDKENYISGTIFIDNKGVAPQDTVGTAQSPAPMQIRGRGNWTWTGFDKKPYKIRLDESHRVLGMPQGKHWALLAAADDNLGFLRNTVGYILSEHMGLRWTPHQEPVELVLNGEYKGLYFLTETVRIQTHRINISEQPKDCTDPDSIRGGWLLEIDNYSAENQLRIREGNGQEIMITIHNPDTLNDTQLEYINAEIATLNEAFYKSTSAHWQQMVDLDELAKFYLVQEITEDTESFHGSCYFYRDMGDSAKWYFGPVWDFGNSFWRHQERFVYENPSFPQYWIGQIATFAAFQQRVQEYWYEFLTTHYSDVQNDILAFKNKVQSAAVKDADCWKRSSNVRTNRDMNSAYNQYMDNLTWRVNWLRSQWGEGIANLNNKPKAERAGNAEKIFMDGQLVILREGKVYSVTGILLKK